MFIQPMLAVDAELKQRENFSYQVKWDGVRCVAYLKNETVKLYGRHGGDLTKTFPEVTSSLVENINWGTFDEVFLDGEIFATLDGSIPDFKTTLSRCAVSSQIKASLYADRNPAKFVVFDTFRGEEDDNPYINRLMRIDDILTPNAISKKIRSFENLEELTALVKASRLEGVVGRNLNGAYRSGERCEIMRWKQISTVDAMIFGYEKGSGVKEKGLGSFLVAAPEGFGWRFIGKVSSGFSDAELKEILSDLEEVEQTPAIDGYEADCNHTFVKPGAIIEISHLGYEETGFLRNPSFVRRRKDKELSSL